jgi:hypothetical protein
MNNTKDAVKFFTATVLATFATQRRITLRSTTRNVTYTGCKVGGQEIAIPNPHLPTPIPALKAHYAVQPSGSGSGRAQLLVMSICRPSRDAS